MAVTTRPFTVFSLSASDLLNQQSASAPSSSTDLSSTPTPTPSSSRVRHSTFTPSTAQLHPPLTPPPLATPSPPSAHPSATRPYHYHRRTRSSLACVPPRLTLTLPSPLASAPAPAPAASDPSNRRDPLAVAAAATQPPFPTLPNSSSNHTMNRLLPKRPKTAHEPKGGGKTLRKAKSTASMLGAFRHSAEHPGVGPSATATATAVDALTLPAASPRTSMSSKAKAKAKEKEKENTDNEEEDEEDDDGTPKFEEIDRWRTSWGGVRLHPYGQDAAYAQKYNSCTSDNEKYLFILLRRLNPSPAFHDYGSRPPASVLDLGCGKGVWALAASRAWPRSRIVGLDLVDVALPEMKTGGPLGNGNVEFKRGNFLKFALPFAAESFEFVRVADLGTAIPYERWGHVITEAHRVLAPGGRLEIIDDQIQWPCGPDPGYTPQGIGKRDSYEYPYPETPRSGQQLDVRVRADSMRAAAEFGGFESEFEGSEAEGDGEGIVFPAKELPSMKEEAEVDEEPVETEGAEFGQLVQAMEAADLDRSAFASTDSILRDDRDATPVPAPESLPETPAPTPIARTPSSKSSATPPASTCYARTSTGEHRRPVIWPRTEWGALAQSARDVETVYECMLRDKFGIPPRPADFLLSVLSQAFGGYAGKRRTVHLKLAPLDAREVFDPTPVPVHAHGPAKKEGKEGWFAKQKGRQMENVKTLRKRGFSKGGSKKDKHGLVLPAEDELAASLQAKPCAEGTISAKAARQLGITLSNPKTPAPQSALNSPRRVASTPSLSSSSTLSVPLPKEPEYHPGLLAWPATFMPMAPEELEWHVGKHTQALLASKVALMEYAATFLDENGEPTLSQADFEDMIADYESFRKIRFNWPHEQWQHRGDESPIPIPEPEFPSPFSKAPADVQAITFSASGTPRFPLASSDALVCPSTDQLLSANATAEQGPYAADELVHVRTIRVYEAFKPEPGEACYRYQASTSKRELAPNRPLPAPPLEMP